MSLKDASRQLYLLLWKNLILRKRKKFRFLTEIVLPLFFFLILMWVRTRGLRTKESQCHFSEKALPSAGLLPFLRSYLCQLNNQCFKTPHDSYSNENLFKILEISNDLLSVTSKENVFNILKDASDLSNQLVIERENSAKLTRTIKLKDVLNKDLDEFKQELKTIISNETLVDYILESNPNFNYLYSNYSSSYDEPLYILSFAEVPQSVINIVYGSELDLIDSNRYNNHVYNSIWIRNQICFNNIQLLRISKNDLNEYLCSNQTSDDQLVQLFILISQEIEWSNVKQKISTNLNSDLFEKAKKLGSSALNLRNEFPDLNKSINLLRNHLSQFKLADICGPDLSQISLFSIFNSFNTTRSSFDRPDLFQNFINALNNNKGNLSRITESLISQDGGLLASITNDDFASTEYDNRPKSFKTGQSEFKRLNKRPNFKRKRSAPEQNNTQFLSTLTSLFESLNNLNKLNSTECPGSSQIKDKPYDSTTNCCLCKTLISLISDVSSGGQTLFNQLKPMFLGKIVYAPNTSAYTKVIQRMNSTFNDLESLANQLVQLAQLTNHTQSLLSQYSNLLDQFQSNLTANEIINQLKLTTQILIFARNLINCFELNKFQGFSNESEAIKNGELLIENDSFYAAIIFNRSNDSNDDDQLPKLVKYKIRMNSSQTHNTRFTQDRFYNFGPSNCLGCNQYFLYGFIYIQDMLEKAIIEINTNQSTENDSMGITTQMTSYPCYVNDKFMLAISRLLPGFMVLSWVYTVSMIVKDIVYEKEKRLKEFMRVMGLTNATHWLAWFITSFVQMFFVCCLLSCIIKYGKVTQFSDITVLMTFYCCFTIATITQCFLISVFFNKANLAAVVAGIIYYLFYLPYTVMVNYSDVLLPWHKLLASLSSTVAFGYGFELVATFELQNIGVQWSNFYSSPYAMRNSFSMSTICLIMLFDAVVYMFLAFYIETVWPGEYGIARPWYFLFSLSYWFETSNSKSKRSSWFKNCFYDSKEKIILDEEEKLKKEDEIITNDSIENIENESDLQAGIEINKLNKVYTRGNNHALKGLSVKFYQNEITAFLGHNGAGKSTTMHILTGLYRPTTGDATINGLSINKSMNKIRKSLGFVPQHNILFPLMSVEEHLWFYARLKGLDRESTLNETEQMLNDTGLESKRNEPSKNLSGGMKRKLSVAIAFVGGSKTVILDEPSAGIDPQGRRSIWDLLFKYRLGRTIMISTHHMDEADVLGDRIAIISNGKLIAHGSSYFLKNKFGQGYYLTFAKRPLIESQEQEIAKEINEKKETLLKSQQDINLYDFVMKRFSQASLIENIGTEMTFSISNKKEFTKNYQEYFNEIELNMNELQIDSMGISDTTLEEIFIRLANEPEANSFQKRSYHFLNYFFRKKSKKEVVKLNEEQLNLYSSYTKLRITSNLLLIFVQLYALFIKRYQRVKRNIKGFFAEIVLPVIFVCMALLVATLTPKPGERVELELHPWYYSEPNQIFLSKSSALDFDWLGEKVQTNLDLVNSITDTFLQPASLGTRCMNNNRIKISRQAQSFSRVTSEEQYFSCENYDFVNLNETGQPGKLFLDQLKSVNYSFTKMTPECDCTSGFPQCPISAAGDINWRKKIKLKTKDIIYDLTSRNISDWLVKTEFSDQFFRRRFGGFEFLVQYTSDLNKMAINSIQNLNQLINLFTNSFTTTNNISANLKPNIQLNNLIRNQQVKVWYNLKGYDTSVSYLNVLNNAILRSKINKLNRTSLNSNDYGIIAFNHPMPNSKSQFIDKLEMQAVIDLFVAICMIFSLSFIPASFLVFLLEERETQSKQLQIVSGIKPYLYWFSNFIWDLFNYVVPCILCIIVFVLFDVKAYMSKENFPCLICVMLLYGFSCIPMMYPLNYVFKVPSTAFVFSSSTNVFIGTVTTMATAVLTQLGNDEPDLLKINEIIKPIFLIVFPHYCLGQSFITMSLLYNLAEIQRSFGMKAEYNPFEFENNGKCLIAMFCQGIVYFTINLLIEYKFFIRFKPKETLNSIKNETDDDDVINERNRVLNLKPNETNNNENDYIKLVNMSKIYKKFNFKKMKFDEHLAVKQLCLGINKGECFGLIGVNGAGKTTSFKMITGEISITAGDVIIGGLSVSKQVEKVHKNIGYCPQFDALMPLLTAREHLVFFARLRGIPEKYVKQVSEWAMNRVGLEIFADRISGDFSGGNKRKLSTAIALVGDPSVICLDEPTSGMDAKARRFLWNDILSLIKENRIVILTSHTMEECEALCTRLVIMVNGEFKCLGSLQHLKSKFGNGYKLAVRLDDENNRNDFFEFMKLNFSDSIMLETHRNLFEYILPFNAATKLSNIFGKLEKNRINLKIKDYSISQSTLDQIFVNFAKGQNEEI